MKQFLYDEKRNIWYERVDDVYLPCLLAIPEQPIGIWAQRRERYLKNHRRVTYTNLLTTGELNRHLREVDERAQRMQLQLTSQIAKNAGVTEQMKAHDQMKWIQTMNAIRAQVREIIYAELIYA